MLTIKEINQKKTQIQKREYDNWVEKKARGAFEWATGVGKTHLATHLAIPTMNRKRPEFRTKVVLPTNVIKDDWEGVGRKAGFIKSQGLKNVDVWIINSFIKMRHECELLIIDEAHRATNEQAQFFSKVLEVCPAPFVMLLSAVFTSEQKEFMRKWNIPIISTITTREAESEGLISPYRVYNIGVDLTEKDREYADDLDANFNKYSAKFNRDMNLAFSCNTSTNPRWDKDTKKWREPYCVTYAREKGWKGIPLMEAVKNYIMRKKAKHGQKGKISIWNDERDNFEFTPSKIQVYASQYIRYMNIRQDFLHNASKKLDVVKEIVEKFKVQTVVFSQRTSFADRIMDMLGQDVCKSYHTNIPSQSLPDGRGDYIRYGKTSKKAGQVKMFGVNTLQRLVIEEFEKGYLQVISAATKLDEGWNVEGIRLAIITGGTGTERQNIQRVGRAVRPMEGKVAVIVNIFVKNSQDEYWLRQRQMGDKPALLIDSVDEITFGYDQQTIDVEGDDSSLTDEGEDDFIYGFDDDKEDPF